MIAQLRILFDKLEELLKEKESQILVIGEIIWIIWSKKLYKYDFIKFENITQNEKYGLPSLGIRRRSAYNYLWTYIALGLDQSFKDWFYTAFQGILEQHGFSRLTVHDIPMNNTFYSIVTKERKKPEERRRLLQDYLVNWVKKRHKKQLKVQQKKIEKEEKLMKEFEESFRYTLENNDFIEGLDPDYIDKEYKAKKKFETFLGDTQVTANYGSRIVISTVRSLIPKDMKGKQLTPYDEARLWEEYILPLIKKINRVIIEHKHEMGEHINDPNLY